MRYALLSDVHANLHTLDAVLADVDKRGDVDAIYHAGDLVGYSSNPNEVMARLHERSIIGIAGNYDSTVTTHYKHCGWAGLCERQHGRIFPRDRQEVALGVAATRRRALLPLPASCR